jgi:hypothetical protein
MGIRSIINRIVEHYAKALYREYPSYDEDGNVIAREWLCVRGGHIGRDELDPSNTVHQIEEPTTSESE